MRASPWKEVRAVRTGRPGIGRLRVVAVVCIVAGGAAATAEDDRPEDPPKPAGVQSNFIDLGEQMDRNIATLGPKGRVAGGRAPGIRVTPMQRRQPAGGEGSVSEPDILAMHREIADERFKQIDLLCGLTEPQRRKLRLALESDIRRSTEAIEAVRRKYRGIRVDQNTPEWHKVAPGWHQDIEACRGVFQSLCDENSTFMRALPATLDADQRARMTAERDTYRECVWRAIVARALLDFDERLGLDEPQSEKLESLLVASPPPLRLHHRQAPTVMFQLGSHLVGLALTRIDDATLSSIVSPRQTKFLRQFANASVGMRQHMESQGILGKETP